MASTYKQNAKSIKHVLLFLGSCKNMFQQIIKVCFDQIYLNCYNIKKWEERRGTRMTTGQTNKMD
jgi:Zn finger protein HypA/HybF involved in hydrogenase expression